MKFFLIAMAEAIVFIAFLAAFVALLVVTP
jgi:hypothetical protein